MFRTYLRFNIKYIKKMFSVYLLMGITIITTLVLVFTPIVVVKSQSLNTKNYLNRYKTHYDAMATNLTYGELAKIRENKDLDNIYIQQNYGTFKVKSDITKYTAKSYNESIFSKERYKIVEGREPKNNNEIIVGNSSNLKKFLGDTINATVTFSFIDEGINKKVNKNISVRIVGLYNREKKSQDIMNMLQIDSNDDILLGTKNPPYESGQYDIYMDFKKGKSKSTIVYELSELIGSYDKVQSNQLSDKINDSFINATDDAIRMFKPIIVGGSLLIFLIYLLVFEDRRNMLNTINTIGGEKRKIVLSMVVENVLIMLITVIIGVFIGILVSKKMMNGTDLTGFVAELNIPDKSLHISYKDILNSSMVSLISLIMITIYEIMAIYEIKLFLNVTMSLKKFFKVKRILRFNHAKYLETSNLSTFGIAKKYFKSSIGRYIIPIFVISMFGSMCIGYYNIKVNDEQFENETRYDQINKHRDYSLTNLSYLGEYSNLFDNNEFKDNTSSVIKEYNTSGFLKVYSDNLDDTYLKMLGLKDVKKIYEMNAFIRGLNDKEISNLLKAGVLTIEDKNTLDTDGAIIIDGFYDRNTASIIKMFKVEPSEANLKFTEYVDEGEAYNEYNTKNILVHKYKELYKLINPELESPMVIIKEDLLKKKSNIHQPTNVYFNLRHFESEKKINKLFYGNKHFVFFNSKEFKMRNKLVSSILFDTVKKINIAILLAFSFISMMFTVKLTILYRKSDIVTLQYIGASENKVLKIFLFEGLILASLCSLISVLYGLKTGYINYSRYLYEQVNKNNMYFIIDYRNMILNIALIIFLCTAYQLLYLHRRKKERQN